MSAKKIVRLPLHADVHDYIRLRAEPYHRSIPGEIREILLGLMHGTLADLGRVTTSSQNGQARRHYCGPDLPRGSAHPAYLGVYVSQTGRWSARVGGKSAGTFDRDWEAAKAVDKGRVAQLAPGNDFDEVIEVNFPRPGTSDTTTIHAYRELIKQTAVLQGQVAAREKELAMAKNNLAMAHAESDRVRDGLLAERDKLRDALRQAGLPIPGATPSGDFVDDIDAWKSAHGGIA